jgi:hypothetical protein
MPSFKDISSSSRISFDQLRIGQLLTVTSGPVHPWKFPLDDYRIRADEARIVPGDSMILIGKQIDTSPTTMNHRQIIYVLTQRFGVRIIYWDTNYDIIKPLTS